jgi:hypothetical protein
MLFDCCENADVSSSVPLALGTRTMITEERFDPVGKVGRLFSVDVDDQGRVVSVAVVDDKREFVESVRVSVRFELLGNALGEIIESSVRRGGIHDSLEDCSRYCITAVG